VGCYRVKFTFTFIVKDNWRCWAVGYHAWVVNRQHQFVSLQNLLFKKMLFVLVIVFHKGRNFYF
jgi:hypothetical protein